MATEYHMMSVSSHHRQIFSRNNLYTSCRQHSLSPSSARHLSPCRPPRRPCLVSRTSSNNNDDTSSSSSDENENQYGNNGNTPRPATRQKKKVVFADDKGFSLAQVRMMEDKSDKIAPLNFSLRPTAPPKQHALLLNAAKTVPPPAPQPISQPQWTIAFAQPASNYIQFREKIIAHFVGLENLIVRANKASGTIKVKNLSYEKRVSVRYTLDKWKTYKEIECAYTEVNSATSVIMVVFDTFSFEFDLPENEGISEIEFCVKYHCEQGEFWDNNGGENYQILKRSRDESKNQYSEDSKIIENGINKLVLTHSWTDAAPYW